MCCGGFACQRGICRRGALHPLSSDQEDFRLCYLLKQPWRFLGIRWVLQYHYVSCTSKWHLMVQWAGVMRKTLFQLDKVLCLSQHFPQQKYLSSWIGSRKMDQSGPFSSGVACLCKQRPCKVCNMGSPFPICNPSCMLHLFGIELKAGFCGFIRKSQTDMGGIIWGYLKKKAFSSHCFVLGLFWGCGLLIKEEHVSNLFTVHSPAGRGEQSKG